MEYVHIWTSKIPEFTHQLSTESISPGYPRMSSWSFWSFLSIDSWKTWFPLEIMRKHQDINDKNRYIWKAEYFYFNTNTLFLNSWHHLIYLQENLQYQEDPVGQNTGQHECNVKRDQDLTWGLNGYLWSRWACESR